MGPNPHMNPKKPNIVFIVLDTHRVDRLGCYGYHKDTTPNIDGFVQGSTLYKKAISPAQWTIPSHASMFSGEYPTSHQTIQAGDALSPNLTTLAEHAYQVGYKTIGFCNNPLVGVLNNGFRRGFQEFYNYGGTIPSTPNINNDNSSVVFSKIRRQYYKLIDHIATPIQQAVAISPEVLQIALNPLLVPLWTRFSNFKGDSGKSIRDTTYFLKSANGSPKFIFLNLMGTHLPYIPPMKYIKKFAPIVMNNPEAGEFMRGYNTQALHWLLPLEKPYPPLQAKTLSDMYDAEVAYQDHLLNQLLKVLNLPEHRENTLVIIVGDHGEMLGEHKIMGHGLGVYEELIHVPLLIRYPGQSNQKQINHAVSTIRVFNTILDAIGFETVSSTNGDVVSIPDTSLRNSRWNPKHIFSEAYPPESLLIIMEKYASDLIERYHCRSVQRAVYNQPYKLIQIENVRDDIYNYKIDPKETQSLKPRFDSAIELIAELEKFVYSTSQKGANYTQKVATNYDDQRVRERLKQLGYFE
jgi:arylsulfatase A-like enzyme